ncbi:MAG: TonB-dependent receptor [Gammaproteobacteria bacterium]
MPVGNKNKPLSGKLTARIKPVLSIWAAALLLAQAPVNAQEAVGDGTTVRYPASYFAEYSPVNAQDMLVRIPGMESVAGSSGGSQQRGNASRGGRGLGSGGGGTQIMINGKRTAGKDNDTKSQLARITADQVNYIELIRGTSGDLDVRGGTQVVNIVLFEQLSNTSLSYDLTGSYYDDGVSKPGGLLSYGGQADALSYLFSAVAEPKYDHRVSTEHSILPGYVPNDRIQEERIRKQTIYTVSTNLGYDFGERSSARFNALYAESDDPTTVDRQTTDLAGIAPVTLREREDIPGQRSNWEIGGDYEYRLDSGSRFKTLFIANENDSGSVRERYGFAADGSQAKNLYLNSASVLQERIVRGSYTMDAFGQNLEFGAERAQTILDSSLRLGVASSTGIASPDWGGLVPVKVANANTRVEELRYEPFLIHNWRITPRMSLETSLVYETSEISQSGDATNSRNFSFFKPKLDYRFDINPQMQLRLLVEKVVRQLSFTDFVAATDNDDNDSNTMAGNTNLRPDYWWNYNLTAEYRLSDDLGVISANFYHHRHVDFMQRIDVSRPGGPLESAPGNLGKADMLVFELKGSLRMTPFGMPNVLVTSLASARDSWVRDPFTSEIHRFNNYTRGQFELGFRHDVPQWRLNYGVNMKNDIDGGTKRWDIYDIESDYADPAYTAFLEVVGFNNLTFRLDIDNLTDVDNCRNRFRYLGHIADNILEEVEYNCGGSGRTFSLKVSGRF